MNKKIIYTFLFVMFGCAQVTSLNLKKHQFGKIPTKIVWIQVAGLTTEHLALLKFSYPSRSQVTSFENSLCIGSSWEYDLYNLRPTAYEGFLSQLSGKKNIQNSCEDFDKKPIWSFLAKQNYKAGIFEGEIARSQSLLKSKNCKDQKDYLKNTTFWSMNKNNSTKNFFHVSDKGTYKKDTVYYDRSCNGKECFSTFSSNIEKTFKSFTKNSKNYIYIVRNFKFSKLIAKNKFRAAKEELNQLNETLNFFQKKAEKNNDMLVLLTTSSSREIEFPKAGKQWERFEKRGRFIKSKNTKLISSVFATGARAENFCGIYDQSQILARIFSGAKQQGLEFSIINPFE